MTENSDVERRQENCRQYLTERILCVILDMGIGACGNAEEM